MLGCEAHSHLSYYCEALTVTLLRRSFPAQRMFTLWYNILRLIYLQQEVYELKTKPLFCRTEVFHHSVFVATLLLPADVDPAILLGTSTYAPEFMICLMYS